VKRYLLLILAIISYSTFAKIPSLKPVNDNVVVESVPGYSKNDMSFQYNGFIIELNRNSIWQYAQTSRSNIGKLVLNQKKEVYVDITGELNTSTDNYKTSAAIVNKDKTTTFLKNKIITQTGFAIDRFNINDSVTSFIWQYVEYLPTTGKYQQHIDLYVYDIRNNKLGYTSLITPLTQDTEAAFLPYRKSVGTGDSVINFKNNIYAFNYKEYDVIDGYNKNPKNLTVKLKYLNKSSPNEKTFGVISSQNPFYEINL
jgi:hypothetical protein